MTTTTIHFNNAQYVRSHMKEPRGFGGWIMEFTAPDVSLVTLNDAATFTPTRLSFSNSAYKPAEVIWVCGTGTLSNVKRDVRDTLRAVYAKHPTKRAVVMVDVLP